MSKLMDFGAVVASIQRTGEMILELKRGKSRKGTAYKCLAED